MPTKRSIEVTTRFVDFHCWPKAPNEVAFLRNLHRHVFHVTVEIAVEANDREIEFFILQKDINELIEFKIRPMKKWKSCEMMAERIAIILSEMYEDREISVKVSEDGENAAIIKLS